MLYAHKHLHPCYYHHHFLTFSFYPDTIAQEIGAQIDDTKHQICQSQRIVHGAERPIKGQLFSVSESGVRIESYEMGK